MSDIDMDTPASSETRGAQTKAARPDLFYGERNKLEAWLSQFDMFFYLEKNIDDKAMFMSTFMRGAAHTWVKPYVTKYLKTINGEEDEEEDSDEDDEEDNDLLPMFNNLAVFKRKLRAAFALPNEVAIAERAIQSLRQKTSVGDYANKFQQYSIQVNWGNAALKRMFKQGLKPNVRAEIMRSAAKITTLEELINEAIRLDNELYELSMETRAYAPTRNDNTRPYKPYKSNSSKPRQTVQGYYNGTGSSAMHLDNINQRKPAPGCGGNNEQDRMHRAPFKGLKDKGKETRSCYNCGKPGHLSRNCKQKKNIVTRQINMMVNTGEEEEWEVVNEKPNPFQDSTKDVIEADDSASDIVEIVKKPRAINDTTTQQSYAPTVRGIWRKWEQECGRDPTFPQPNMQDVYKIQNYISSSAPKHHKPYHLQGNDNFSIRQLLIAISEVTEYSQQGHDWTLLQQALNDPDKAKRSAPGIPQAMYNEWRARRTKAWIEPPHPGTPVTWTYDPSTNTTSTAYWYDLEGVKHYGLETDIVFKRGTEVMHDTPTGTSVWEYTNDDRLAQATENLQINTSRERARKKSTKRKEAPLPLQPDYTKDPRNLRHDCRSWTACYTDDCQIHESDKLGSGYFPKQRNQCKWRWDECPKIDCERHLWDKRETLYFPGMDENELERLNATINNRCNNDTWHTCTSKKCERHLHEKEYEGFLPTTRNPSFLGDTSYPRAATPLTPPDSSYSQ